MPRRPGRPTLRPMDRPHYQFWPKRLPHSLTVPATSLWDNLETSAPLSAQAGAGVLRPRLPLCGTAAAGRAPGRPAACPGGAQGRPRAAGHAELPAAGDRAFRHPACQRGGGAGEPDESRRGAEALHHRPRREGCHHHRRPRARNRQGGRATARSAAPAASGRDAVHRRLRPGGPQRRPDAGELAGLAAHAPSVAAVGQRRGPRLGRGAGQRCCTAAGGGPVRPRRAALHQRHHGQPQRLHAHAPHRDAQRRWRAPPGATAPASRSR